MSSAFQGLLDANGRIRTSQTGPIVSHFRGLPLNAAGEILGGPGPIVRFDQGIPFNAAGAVVGIQAAQPSAYGPGATPYGPNGELEIAPVGVINHFYQGVPYNVTGLYCTSSAAGAPTIVSEDFNIVPGVISPSSVGYRAAPLVGQMTPVLYAGGTIILVQATDNDEFRVETQGAVQFPDISGNLTVQLPAYVGPNRLILTWDPVSQWYDTIEPGIYNYLLDFVGTGIPMRFSAAPAGTA